MIQLFSITLQLLQNYIFHYEYYDWTKSIKPRNDEKQESIGVSGKKACPLFVSVMVINPVNPTLDMPESPMNKWIAGSVGFNQPDTESAQPDTYRYEFSLFSTFHIRLRFGSKGCQL